MVLGMLTTRGPRKCVMRGGTWWILGIRYLDGAFGDYRSALLGLYMCFFNLDFGGFWMHAEV